MIIVDSTVWIDYFNGVRTPETDWFHAEAQRQRFGLTALILCEVLQGLRDDGLAARVEAQLRRFEILDGGDAAVAIQAARNYRKLRARGRTVRSTVDALIATFCIERGHRLLHRDRDFDAFEELCGLSVVHPVH
ncbi:MAG: PIN domain nuclease [Acidobacteria bacterium]|nr:MAG: PIN domain nuclease [Acidobacteriota bacterium]